jgi:predicted branched-subunit amino acid permease
LGLWITWQISTAAGIFLGTVIPPSWSLDFTLALTFIALVMPVLRDRPSLAAALSAGVTAVVAFSLPYKLGLVIATLVGIAVGMGMEAKR